MLHELKQETVPCSQLGHFRHVNLVDRYVGDAMQPTVSLIGGIRIMSRRKWRFQIDGEILKCERADTDQITRGKRFVPLIFREAFPRFQAFVLECEGERLFSRPGFENPGSDIPVGGDPFSSVDVPKEGIRREG